MSIDNIRVQVNRKYHEIYRQLVGQVSPYPKICSQHADVFTLCVCLGYRAGGPNQVKGADLFWSQTFDSYQENVIKSLAIRDTGDYTCLDEPASIIQIAQGYADAGMEILLDQVLRDFVRSGEAAELSLNYNDSSQLEKSLLAFIQSEFTRDPLTL